MMALLAPCARDSISVWFRVLQERHIDKIFIPPNLTQLEAGRMLVGRLMEAYLLVNDLGRDLVRVHPDKIECVILC